MKKLLPILPCLLTAGGLLAQSFTQKQSLIDGQQFYSGVAIGVVDMNGDGRDDLVHLKQGTILQIEYQNGPGEQFTSFEVGQMAKESVWAMCVGDFDNNGFPDVMAGGYYDGIHLARANADGSAYTIETFADGAVFTQAANFADINDDGWLDLFVCHDDGPAHIWGYDDASGQFDLHMEWMPTALQGGMDENDSGNYGICWTDIDNDGDWEMYEAKCRQGINDPNDPRRINLLYINNGDGTYTEDAGTRGLKIGAQSWTCDFGDIDNDGDMDCFVTNHDVKSQLLLNDGTGHFTDISATSGIEAVPGLPIQGVFRDFDNDGWLDIITAGDEAILLKNNGDKTFSEVPAPFDNNPMESFAIGDMNHDGFLDVYGGYAIVYTEPSTIEDKIFLNDGNANNWLGVNLVGQSSNRSGIHARIKIFTPQGIQIREVRGGESYGIMNSLTANFGLGQTATVDSITIRWPSGITDVVKSPAVNQYIQVTEGGCVSSPQMVTAAGPTVFCTGQSVQLDAPAGFETYLWSTGETTQSITATTAGNYRVTLTSADGCKAVTNTIKVVTDPVQIPTIAIAGDTVFCKGGSVVLTSSLGQSYLWNNGETTQSITVTQSGVYSVATQGLCAAFNSAESHVEVLDAPDPAVTGDKVAPNAVANLFATGDELHWFDTQTGGNELFVGNNYATVPLAQTTVFWVENRANYPGVSFQTGQTSHSGGQFGGVTFNGELLFDAEAEFILDEVKIYTNTPGVRHIMVLDADGNKIAGKSVDIPVGTAYYKLGFDIPAATGLRLMTDPDTNTVNFNSVSPRLRRSDADVEFPYVVPGIVSINASNFGIDRYYYFYDWHISTPGHVCTSGRVPVTAIVDPTLSAGELTERIGCEIFPNPTTGRASIELDLPKAEEVLVEISDAAGRMVYSEKLEAKSGKSRLSRDFGQLGEGVFFVKMAAASGVASRKLVID